MHNMQAIVDRVWQAIEQNERLVIFSDYDADGVPGAVVFSDFLTKIGFSNFTVHIPNRNTDGFGLNMQAVEQFIADGVDLLITIDCGIADLAEIAALQSGGVEVIITDHHLPSSEGEPNCLVLDPKQQACQYPFADLCGAGVIFKLVQGMIAHARDIDLSTRKEDAARSRFIAEQVVDLPIGYEKWLLDMVGIATICDMVPLVGENRVFAHYGLQVLRKSPRPGLQKMLALARAHQPTLTAQDVAFTLGPRINAASRLGEGEVAFTALRAVNGDADLRAEAIAAAEELERVNRARKTRVAQAAKAAYAR
jgi:single-stranded-DNA-specific exonuclease